MMNTPRNQLALILDSENSEAVLNEACVIFSNYYRTESFKKIKNAFSLINSLFRGNYKGYRKCNTEYHDLKHTHDAFLATARLIDGMNITGEMFSESKAVNLLMAALLHDTGYIQEESDAEGTGAKYTAVHVKRSIEFTERNASNLHISETETAEIASFISCTGMKSDHILTLEGENRRGGCILGTADLIGQMSDRAYLEKLLFLYYEFNEAGMEGFDTTFDILRKTLAFYETTMDRLDNTLQKSYNLALYHFKSRYSIEENMYMTAIDNQMNYLKKIIDDESTNFRNKLKRLNVEEIESRYRAQSH